MKYIELVASNGSVWTVPAHVVAESAAIYYSANDQTLNYEEEFNYYMSSDAELIDWAINNMNPEDFGDAPRMIQPPSSSDDFCTLWRESDSESINVREYELKEA